jgi:hypothetical protein
MRAEPIRKTSVDLILVEDLNEKSSFVPVDLDSISRNLELLYFICYVRWVPGTHVIFTYFVDHLLRVQDPNEV